jgi:hypothetical protein
MSPVKGVGDTIPRIRTSKDKRLKYVVPILDPADRRFWPNIRISSLWWTNERLHSLMNRGRLGSQFIRFAGRILFSALIYTSASRFWRCRQCFKSYFAAYHVVPGNDTPIINYGSNMREDKLRGEKLPGSPEAGTASRTTHQTSRNNDLRPLSATPIPS